KTVKLKLTIDMKKQLNIASLTLLYWGLKTQEKEILLDFDKQQNEFYLKANQHYDVFGLNINHSTNY
ncbi:hypothetical protein, partial [Tenacibaculum amylolyticum]|uniref:hypothetical protein n=1 Tax=Tenacibaculum amylolyticum TaxID=104269 RepID=UPI0038B42675